MVWMVGIERMVWMVRTLLRWCYRVGMFEMVQMGLCADGWDRWVGSDNCIMFEMIGMVGAVGMVRTMGSADSSHGVIRDE